MRTKAFWTATGERAIKTFAQTLAALLSGDGLGLLDVAWTTSASIAGLAAVVSILTSVGSSTTGQAGPSLGQETVT